MAISPTTTSLRPWSDLPPELLGHAIAHLPFPADRARFRAVCRRWRSAARSHIRQFPWLVLPDGSFCTAGARGEAYYFCTVPSVPDDATCVGSTGRWLALDRTNYAYPRSKVKLADMASSSRRDDTKHAHNYLLHDPFSGATVPLPEVDAIAGNVSEWFEIRKVLMMMRSSVPDEDIIAVVTNSIRCNIILCRPGKGACVLEHFRVFDVAFLGDCLYGITPDEDLFAFHLAEDGDGKPIVTRIKRVIKHHPLVDEEDFWSWVDEEDDDMGNDDNDGNGDGDQDVLSIDDDEEEELDDGDSDSFNGDGMISDGEEMARDEEVLGEARDYITTTRRLVKSQSGELLMVRRCVQEPPCSPSYTRKVEVFKADVTAGKWVLAADGGLAQDEAIFLSRFFSKSTPAYGDIKAGFIYSDDSNDVVNTRSWTRRPFRFPQVINMFTRERRTWIFPPELVV
ncbi:unnamed protein product [Urochloa decumbens]|uniref:F-box domain-containing protein n=1 Tax=Urochloa decumbens TaxID=240449 RepID=A0ABC9BXH0_9POAL